MTDRLTRRDDMLHRASKKTLIMGILNATPDSFSDGGVFDTPETGAARALHMQQEGAHIIDIGGESTRPGAVPVSEADERARVMGLIETVSQRIDLPISIDTYKAAIAREAAEAGAVLINDVWGMTRDLNMAAAVADTESAIVVTYNRGTVSEDIDIAGDMHDFMRRAFETAERAGIPKDHIWLDPGVGFAKTQEQNMQVLRRLDVLLAFGCPVLVGVSRKSLIGHVLDRSAGERLAGTLGAHLAAVDAGANIVRVHDVRAHADALTMRAIVRGGAL